MVSAADPAPVAPVPCWMWSTRAVMCQACCAAAVAARATARVSGRDACNARAQTKTESRFYSTCTYGNILGKHTMPSRMHAVDLLFSDIKSKSSNCPKKVLAVLFSLHA